MVVENRWRKYFSTRTIGFGRQIRKLSNETRDVPMITHAGTRNLSPRKVSTTVRVIE